MIFTIKKSKHYSDRLLTRVLNLFTFSGHIERSVTFDNSCKYQLNQEDQGDVNKLFGYSIGINHHRNSSRFGWNWLDESLQLYAYLYREGERAILPLAELKVDRKYYLSIEAQETSDCFIVRDEDSVISVANVERRIKFRGGFQLWPYFGGNWPAPHDIRIKMEI